MKSLNLKEETIVAISTPFGKGGIGVLRISGSLVKIVSNILLKKIPNPRSAEYLKFFDENDSILDRGIAIFFPHPNSFTGEDVLEIHCHGSPIILKAILNRILLISGVRVALPGEFSKRAFLNGKIDLTQAEAIIDIINANSHKAAKLANNLLNGNFSKRICSIIKNITNLQLYIEASINFPEEEIDFLPNEKIKNILEEIIHDIKKIYEESHMGSVIREGKKVVIVGEPNVGKSSILNMLSKRNVSIVSPFVGTTRDVIHENIQINGSFIDIIDTAGLHDTDDEIEKIGISLAWNEIKNADHIILVIDNYCDFYSSLKRFSKKLHDRSLNKKNITVVKNKIDLSNEKPSSFKEEGYVFISVSVKSKKGIDLLFNHLKEIVEFTDSTETCFLARQRHLNLLKKSIIHLDYGREFLEKNEYYIEILAEEISLAKKSLNEILGKYISEDIIEKIFSEFCIGK